MAPAHRSTGAHQLVAYVVPRGVSTESIGLPPEERAQGDLVERWKLVYDEIYSRGATEADSTFNIVGWTSSYTGLPIPAEEMREQVDATVARILALNPRRILEIGCGTGLLLFRLAPHCASYRASDLSPVAVDYIRTVSARLGLTNVQVNLAGADDFATQGSEAFDAIVLNSVVQYFPSVEYLRTVLQGAIDRLAPGGGIFVGDVRSLPLLEALHTSIELHDASAALPVERLRERVRRRAAYEQELVIDPAFFHALKRELPQIARVECRPKRGRHWNELTRFRYDVTLHTDRSAPPAGRHRVLDWDGFDMPALSRMLDEGECDVLEIKDISDARVDRELKAVALLTTAASPQTAGELKKALRLLPDEGIDVEHVWALGNAHDYDVDVRLARSGSPGRIDVVFTRRHLEIDRAAVSDASSEETPTDADPRTAGTNRPLAAMRAQQQLPALRSFLKDRLPEHMLPAVFVVLDALPLTPGGKLDRQALPSPDGVRPELAGRYVAPRTPVEQRLAEIEEGLLGLTRIGVHDNFFTELGGHSLLATQLVSRIRDALQIELGLRQIFDTPTIALLAEAIVASPRTASTATAPIRPAREAAVDVGSLSDAEVEALLEGLVREREERE